MFSKALSLKNKMHGGECALSPDPQPFPSYWWVVTGLPSRIAKFYALKLNSDNSSCPDRCAKWISVAFALPSGRLTATPTN